MLEFCLVGAGFIGPVHAANIAAHPGARLKYVVDLNAASAETIAGHFDAAVVTLDQALADPALGAVVICTPAHTHAAIIERAARAGKAILCEKPIDLDLAKVDGVMRVLAETKSPSRSGSTAASIPATARCARPSAKGRSGGSRWW